MELSVDDQIYFQYFEASIIKRLGMFIEAREQFHKIISEHEINISLTINFKVFLKLSKIYTNLYNHFKARQYLKKAR